MYSDGRILYMQIKEKLPACTSAQIEAVVALVRNGSLTINQLTPDVADSAILKATLDEASEVIASLDDENEEDEDYLFSIDDNWCDTCCNSGNICLNCDESDWNCECPSPEYTFCMDCDDLDYPEE